MSALAASPIVLGSSPTDPVRALQWTLYRAAKADPGRRFHALGDKVHRRDVLMRAWSQVRRNDGAPGIDATTLKDVEEYGIERFLGELATDLRGRNWRPLPSRRVLIPKSGSKEKRPLSIPAIRDRVVQAALKILLEPIFEADMLPCSFGFRPKRGAHDALQVLIDQAWRGRRWVVETDIANCFEAIDHTALMQAVEERICDQTILKLLRATLRAGVMEDGQVRRPVTGTPQGGVISPLLANILLHQVDRTWDSRRNGELVRYADDLVVMCASRRQAEVALRQLSLLLADLGLKLKSAKTRIIHLTVGGEGFDFLGFHHRWVRSKSRTGKRPVEFLARWPSNRAMQHARDKLCHFTQRSRLMFSVEDVVQDMNRFLRGWAAYFRFGNSAARLDEIVRYSEMRLVRFIAKRHRRTRAFGWRRFHEGSPSRLGLLTLHGIVVAPRPFRDWRGKPYANGERRR